MSQLLQESLYNINYVYLLNGNDDILEKWFKIVEDELLEYSKDSGELSWWEKEINHFSFLL